MRSSRKQKKLNRSHHNNDIIISDDIEPTESFAGVGDNNIVNISENNENILNYRKSYLTKSPTKPSRPSEFLISDNVSTLLDLKPSSVSHESPDCKSVNISKKKKKSNSTNGNPIEINAVEKLPPLPTKKSGMGREIPSEEMTSINDQIEKFEYRKLKLSITEKKSRMKEFLDRGRQNWSKFKSEIEFIKSVESSHGNVDYENENMIKNENILNVILNEIAIDEKENLEENLSNFDILENSVSECQERSENTSQNDDESEEIIQFQSVINPMVKEYPSQPLSDEMAINLKHLLFNSTCRSWGSEWYKQNIEFHPINGNLPFGIIQKYEGPNNVMAVVQAEFLVEALFCGNINANWISNVKKNRIPILATALSNIVARCRKSESDPYQICLLDMNLKGRKLGVVKIDGLTECLVIYEIFKKEELKKFIFHNINQFTDSCNPGLILLVISCLMTQGLSRCKNNLENQSIRLINPLGVSVDELLSLLIHGSISSHYFNDKIEIVDPESGKSHFLHGVMKRSSIGFLAIEKHCDYCQQIGTYLKTPKYPVWITKWNNNYSVLYCHNRTLTTDWKTEIRFKLFLYSPMFRNHEQVSMIIDSSQSQMERQKLKEEEHHRIVEKEKKFKNLTENRLKTMSENTLKFLLDDCSIDDYMEHVGDNPCTESNLNYLEEIIHIKWPNASVSLEEYPLDICNLFKH